MRGRPIVGATAVANVPTLTGADPLQKFFFSNLSGPTLADITVPAFNGFADGSVPPPITITYNLNGSFILSQFGSWNADNGVGFQSVLIESSTDDITYTPLTGGTFLADVHTFARSTASVGHAAEIVGFNQVTASFFRFTVFNNYDPTFPNNPAYNTIMLTASRLWAHRNSIPPRPPSPSASCPS